MRYANLDIGEFKRVDTSCWDGFKNNVFVRLENKKTVDSQPEYENVIKVPFMDLYKLFYIREISTSDNTVYFYDMKKPDMKKFNVKFKKLNAKAQENHESDRKARIVNMKESMIMQSVLQPIVKVPNHSMLSDSEGSGIGVIIDTDENGQKNVLLMENTMNVFASSYIANWKIINDIWKSFGEENFYIIPLSKHSSMCIKESYVSNNFEKSREEYEDDMFTMLNRINSDSRNWKDILSYRLYYFIGDDGMRMMSIKEER